MILLINRTSHAFYHLSLPIHQFTQCVRDFYQFFTLQTLYNICMNDNNQLIVHASHMNINTLYICMVIYTMICINSLWPFDVPTF